MKIEDVDQEELDKMVAEVLKAFTGRNFDIFSPPWRMAAPHSNEEVEAARCMSDFVAKAIQHGVDGHDVAVRKMLMMLVQNTLMATCADMARMAMGHEGGPNVEAFKYYAGALILGLRTMLDDLMSIGWAIAKVDYDAEGKPEEIFEQMGIDGLVLGAARPEPEEASSGEGHGSAKPRTVH